LDVPEIVARFKREALLLARTRSAHVPRAIDFIIDDTFGPVLVTDLVEGECLSNVLTAPLSVEETIDLGIDLATGIADLHRAHVVHRDLKPSNVILTPTADGERRAMILDLGVSRWVNEELALAEESEISAITIGDNVVGTLEYMPPEQLLHCADVTSAADVYALGAILARAVLGRHIFGALEKVELVKTKLTTDAPALETGRSDRMALGLVAVVRRALERDIGDRYGSAEDLRDELQALRAGPRPTCPTGTGTLAQPPPQPDTLQAWEPTQTIPASKSKPPVNRARPVRRRVVTAVMLTLLILGIAVCSREPKALSPTPSAAAATP
jgi:serine/threonine-protein kinase